MTLAINSRSRFASSVVLEATGGLAVPVTGALAEAGLPVVVVNPRPARAVANATGRLAKPDSLDAQRLAHVAKAVRPTPRPLPAAQAQALSAMLTRRRQLVQMLTAERRRRQTAPQQVRADIQAHITWLMGVAPLHRNSGTGRGTRAVWGGRGHGRAVLDMSTWAAVRHHPVLKAFDERLRVVGKAPKVALTACMRQLLTILNAMLQHRTPWYDTYATQA